MSKAKRLKATDQLRRAIDDSGVTRYVIAKETGIDESTLSKFYRGQGWLSVESFEALGAFLELEITTRRKPAKKGN